MMDYQDTPCKYCHELTLIYHQYIGDARCESCGEWQQEEETMRYYVTWDIDVDTDVATTPRKAAEEAQKIQRDPHSTATIFNVVDNYTGERTIVDLENDNE